MFGKNCCDFPLTLRQHQPLTMFTRNSTKRKQCAEAAFQHQPSFGDVNIVTEHLLEDSVRTRASFIHL